MTEYNIQYAKESPFDVTTDTIITFKFEEKKAGKTLQEINKRYNNLAVKLEERGEISGEYGVIGQFYINGETFKKVYVIGLGLSDELQFSSLKNILSDVIRLSRDSGAKAISVDADPLNGPDIPLKMGKAIADVLATTQYRFEKYIQQKKRAPVTEFLVHSSSKKNKKRFCEGLKIGQLVGNVVNFSKDLCNEPSNVLTPTRFADISSELAADCGLTCKIIGPEQMKELGMELILAVSKGSVEEPRLIMLEYCGDPKNKKTIGLLGKGITFDAGGINLKQGNTMFNMKRDMTGGAIVIGIMKVLASLKPKLNCVAVVPASENMPQGNACKPGDIYRSLSGKWVEIINTDAEGRLVMADAMTYMQQQYHISTLIDVATLTVTARQSIGTSLISVFSNNDTLFEEMKWSGLLAGEELWRFPLYQKYKKGIRSYFSDLKNSTFTPPSSIKAALFLEDFLEKGVEWMHMDIATVDHSNKDLGVNSRGATVTGMRSLTNYLLMKGKVLNA